MAGVDARQFLSRVQFIRAGHRGRVGVNAIRGLHGVCCALQRASRHPTDAECATLCHGRATGRRQAHAVIAQHNVGQGHVAAVADDIRPRHDAAIQQAHAWVVQIIGIVAVGVLHQLDAGLALVEGKVHPPVGLACTHGDDRILSVAAIGVAALLIGADIAALGAAAGRAARLNIAIQRRHIAIGHRVGAGWRGKAVIALCIRRGRKCVRAIGGRNHHARHRRNHASAGQAIGVALDPHAVAELGWQHSGRGVGDQHAGRCTCRWLGKAEVQPVVVLARAAGGVVNRRGAAHEHPVAIAHIGNRVIAAVALRIGRRQAIAAQGCLRRVNRDRVIGVGA